MSKIIEVDFSIDRGPPIIIKETRLCLHKAIIVHEADRIITCSACNAVLDPFNYLLEWAKGDRRIEMWRQHAEKELKEFREKLANLKRDEKNTRARLKRLTA